MEAPRTLLMSIKPCYATKIFDGTKTVELRKREPRVKSGTKIVVYASSPVRQVLGSCSVTSIETDEPNKIWERVKLTAGISKADFDRYFDGKASAVAIFIEHARTYKNPVNLAELRSSMKINPPQSFRYIPKGMFPDSRKVESLKRRGT